MENLTSLPQKTDVQLHQEALMKQRREEKAEENQLNTKVETPGDSSLTARELKKDLIGSFDARMKETKTNILILTYGKRPEVIFEGFWNGKLVNSAMNAISRSYRLQRHKPVRIRASIPQNLEVGDGNN